MNKAYVLLHNDLIIAKIQELKMIKHRHLKMYSLATIVAAKPVKERPSFSDDCLKQLRQKALQEALLLEFEIKDLNYQIL